MANAVGWFEIYVQDMARAKKFYEAVFQQTLRKLDSPHDMWAFGSDMQQYGASGALIKMEGAPSGFAGAIVYFTCADCAVEADRATRNGGDIFKPKTSIGPYGFIALVHDTEGNLIGLHSMQ